MVLRYLIVLGQVGIVVVFPVKRTEKVYLAVKRKRCLQAVFQGLLVEHREYARHTQTHGADLGIRGCAKNGRTPAPELGRSRQLRVCLKTYNYLVFHISLDSSLLESRSFI